MTALLQLVLGVLAVYHLVIGALSVLSLPATARVTVVVYGIQLTPSPQVRYAVRMLGLYALALGTLLTFAAFGPSAHKELIAVVASLQLARAASRALLHHEVTAAFRVSERGNVAATLVLTAEAAVLLAGLAAA